MRIIYDLNSVALKIATSWLFFALITAVTYWNESRIGSVWMSLLFPNTNQNKSEHYYPNGCLPERDRANCSTAWIVVVQLWWLVLLLVVMNVKLLSSPLNTRKAQVSLSVVWISPAKKFQMDHNLWAGFVHYLIQPATHRYHMPDGRKCRVRIRQPNALSNVMLDRRVTKIRNLCHYRMSIVLKFIVSLHSAERFAKVTVYRGTNQPVTLFRFSLALAVGGVRALVLFCFRFLSTTVMCAAPSMIHLFIIGAEWSSTAVADFSIAPNRECRFYLSFRLSQSARRLPRRAQPISLEKRAQPNHHKCS